MLSRSLLFAVLASSCRSQYQMDAEVRADITFNDDNDRFDVRNIINDQQRMFSDVPSPMEQDWRRSYGSLAEMLKQDRRRYQQAKGKSLRRMDSDFAYHDLMLDENDYTQGQYENNLKKFKTQRLLPRRREEPRFMFAKMKRDNSENVAADNNGKSDVKDVVLNYLHGGKDTKPARRMDGADARNEILLHYAVPLNVKVRGFLEMPQQPLD